jgi:hypothetical protein
MRAPAKASPESPRPNHADAFTVAIGYYRTAEAIGNLIIRAIFPDGAPRSVRIASDC